MDRPSEEPILVALDRLRPCPKEVGDDFGCPVGVELRERQPLLNAQTQVNQVLLTRDQRRQDNLVPVVRVIAQLARARQNRRNR